MTSHITFDGISLNPVDISILMLLNDSPSTGFGDQTICNLSGVELPILRRRLTHLSKKKLVAKKAGAYKINQNGERLFNCFIDYVKN